MSNRPQDIYKYIRDVEANEDEIEIEVPDMTTFISGAKRELKTKDWKVVYDFAFRVSIVKGKAPLGPPYKKIRVTESVIRVIDFFHREYHPSMQWEVTLIDTQRERLEKSILKRIKFKYVENYFSA